MQSVDKEQINVIDNRLGTIAANVYNYCSQCKIFCLR